MLPRLNGFQKGIFGRKVTAFNETFAPVGKNKKAPVFAAIWNESVTGRKRDDILSTFRAFLIENKNCAEIKIWLDNCSGQNKNWSLYALLVQMVNSQEISGKKIILSYFEPGHTYMSADSFHASVEKSLKKFQNIEDWNDFRNGISLARKNVIVKDMQYFDFFDYDTNYSIPKLNKNTDRPYLSTFVYAEFIRGKYTISYKKKWSESSLIEFDFLKTKIIKTGFPKFEFLKNNMGIEKSKKDEIVKNLCPLLKHSSREYWKNIDCM